RGHARAPSVPAAGVHGTEGPRRDRAGPHGGDPEAEVVPVYLRADRARPGGVQGADAPVRGLSGERPVSIQSRLRDAAVAQDQAGSSAHTVGGRPGSTPHRSATRSTRNRPHPLVWSALGSGLPAVGPGPWSVTSSLTV